MGAVFKEYSNVCHYIAYSFGRTGLLDFSLFTGYRPDLLRGEHQGKSLSFLQSCTRINSVSLFLSVFRL